MHARASRVLPGRALAREMNRFSSASSPHGTHGRVGITAATALHLEPSPLDPPTFHRARRCPLNRLICYARARMHAAPARGSVSPLAQRWDTIPWAASVSPAWGREAMEARRDAARPRPGRLANAQDDDLRLQSLAHVVQAPPTAMLDATWSRHGSEGEGGRRRGPEAGVALDAVRLCAHHGRCHGEDMHRASAKG